MAKAQRPAEGTQVEVRGPWSAEWLPSHVVADAHDALVITAPTLRGTEPVAPTTGDRIELRWTLPERGIGMLDGSIVDASTRGSPTWRVRCESDPAVEQRRDYFRLPATLAVPARGLRGADPRATEELTTIDVSEGGMSCLAPAVLGLTVGDVIEATLDVQGRRIEVTARIVRVVEVDEGTVDIGCRFVDLPEPDATHIRRFIFAEQARRKPLGTE